MNVDPLELRETADGVVLKVKALPGSRRNEIKGIHAGSLKVAVTAAAEKGKANQAVLALLANALRLRPRQLEIIQGSTSPSKSVLIHELDSQTVRDRLSNH